MKRKNNNFVWSNDPACLLLLLLILTVFATKTKAINADSLGGNPWNSYLRSDVPDTALSSLWINSCTYAQFTADSNHYGMYWSNYGLASVYAENHSRGGWGILANHHGIDNGIDTSRYWMEIRCDSTGGGLKIEGQEKAIFPIKVNNPSKYGAGIGVFTDQGSGIYIDHGGSTNDTNSKALFVENNFSSVGYGLYMIADKGSTGKMVWYEDRGTGRMIRTQQYDLNKPAMTVVFKDTTNSRLSDSTTYYWWGVKTHKIVADTLFGYLAGSTSNGQIVSETLTTRLCGRRYFRNAGSNIVDTILSQGISDSNTTVTVTYGKDLEALTWNSLMAWVATDTVFVQRQQRTDPNNYYWQALKTVVSGQISKDSTILQPPVEIFIAKLRSVYPVPASDKVNIDYSIGEGGGLMSLAVYNLLGQRVRTLLNNWQPAGAYKLVWKGNNEKGETVAAGIYLCKMQIGEYSETKKIVFVR
jgi:hypothetical protein